LLVLLLFLSLFFLFLSIVNREVPDIYTIKAFVIRFALPLLSSLGFFIVFLALTKTPLGAFVWAFLGWHVPLWINESVAERKKAKYQKMAADFVTSAAGLFAVGQPTSEVVRTMAERFDEPFATEFKNMLTIRNANPSASFPRMFKDMVKKYGVEEFKAVASIISASEIAGGPYAAAKGLKRLGYALRQRERILTERRKAMFEPKAAAVFAVFVLLVGFIMDGTIFSHLFTGIGRMIMFASSLIIVGLIFMIRKISKTTDL